MGRWASLTPASSLHLLEVGSQPRHGLHCGAGLAGGEGGRKSSWSRRGGGAPARRPRAAPPWPAAAQPAASCRQAAALPQSPYKLCCCRTRETRRATGGEGGTNGQVATTAVPLRGRCLSDYIHSDSKLPECCNLLSCHVSVPSLFLCHLGNRKALAQPGIAQLFALSQSEVRSVHPLATALVAHCRLISILPADLTIKL